MKNFNLKAGTIYLRLVHESDAAFMLNKLGVPDEYHYMKMAELPSDMKVKVLLAQALFGNPDILLLDEPTNHLDVDAKEALKEALKEYRGSVLLICHEPEFYQDVVSQVWDCSKWTTKIL